MFTLVLLLGLIAAATLVQQNQDINKRASGLNFSNALFSDSGGSLPDCTDFNVPFYHDRGEVIQVSCAADSPDNSIDRVEFYYAKYYDWQNKLCDVDWKPIGIAYAADSSNIYKAYWDTGDVQLDRYIVIARVYDNTGQGCTGNPGACSLPVCSSASGETNSPKPLKN